LIFLQLSHLVISIFFSRNLLSENYIIQRQHHGIRNQNYEKTDDAVSDDFFSLIDFLLVSSRRQIRYATDYQKKNDYTGNQLVRSVKIRRIIEVYRGFGAKSEKSKNKNWKDIFNFAD
jgi:hypothetical protein